MSENYEPEIEVFIAGANNGVGRFGMPVSKVACFFQAADAQEGTCVNIVTLGTDGESLVDHSFVANRDLGACVTAFEAANIGLIETENDNGVIVWVSDNANKAAMNKRFGLQL